MFIVDYKLLTFFYNAQYKGLFFDGGYFHNIPFNYFRDEKSEIMKSGVLALKLDNSYPPEHLEELNRLFLEEEIRKEMVERALQEFVQEGFVNNDFTKIAGIITRVNAELFGIESTPELKTDYEQTLFILNHWISQKSNEDNKKPWSKTKNIIATAFEGSSYGAEQGQLKSITDNDFLIPLYDYGVGVYDFDFSKVMKKSLLAQAKAKKAIENYFE